MMIVTHVYVSIHLMAGMIIWLETISESDQMYAPSKQMNWFHDWT